MSEKVLTALTEAITAVTASHRALERAVFALIATHPNKPAFVSVLKTHLELDTVIDLYEDLPPESERAFERQRERLLASVQVVVGGTAPSGGDASSGA